MSPLARMRKSRDAWKMKNGIKRRKMNQLKRTVSAQVEQIEGKDKEIERLSGLLTGATSSTLESSSPNIEEIRRRLKELEEETRRQREECERYKEELERLEKDNDRQEQEIERLHEELESKKAMVSFGGGLSVQVLCVFLVITCGIPFRSVPKILGALVNLGILGPLCLPHFTSVINWVLRVGVDLLRRVHPIDEPWIAIMDTSIDVGIRKAIVILRVRLSALKERGSAITLQDCQIIFLKIVESCTGEVISECLETAFKAVGKPVAILKDGGKDLNKGTLIYRKQYHCKTAIGVIEDLGHFIANALKAEFAKAVGFKRLLALVYGGQKRLRQTNAAAFVPPKLRTKGRFQGISRLAEWALWILDIMAVQGQVTGDSTVATLRRGFPKLPRLRSFIEKFALTCKVMNELQELLKNKGLNQETYRGALSILQQLPESSHTRQEVQTWLTRHLGLQCRMSMAQTPLLVSSDAIESLMGRLKAVLGRSSMGELNRMTLALPTFCGQLTPEEIAKSLEQTSQVDLWKTEKDVIPPTLLQQRRSNQHFLKLKKEVPKTSPLKMTG
jgi:hypothetical protein